MKVYVASSWRNEVYPEVVKLLREAGHEVYDFRHQSVSWEQFDWNVTDGVASGELFDVLNHPAVQTRFSNGHDGAGELRRGGVRAALRSVGAPGVGLRHRHRASGRCCCGTTGTSRTLCTTPWTGLCFPLPTFPRLWTG